MTEIPENFQQPDLVFVCGPLYRCGSTLIQRVLNVHDDMLVYGEDNNILKFGRVLYEHSKANERLGEQQSERFKQDPTGWQANLSPGAGYYLEAYGQYLSHVLLAPGRATNVGRDIFKLQYVGCKSLIGHPRDLNFVKWLLPSCKIIYCVRNFGDCLRSYMRQAWGQMPAMEVFNLWHQAIQCIDEAADSIDLVVEYQSEPDAEKLTEQLQNILPRVKLDVDKVRAVTQKKIVFDEVEPELKELPKWSKFA